MADRVPLQFATQHLNTSRNLVAESRAAGEASARLTKCGEILPNCCMMCDTLFVHIIHARRVQREGPQGTAVRCLCPLYSDTQTEKVTCNYDIGPPTQKKEPISRIDDVATTLSLIRSPPVAADDDEVDR